MFLKRSFMIALGFFMLMFLAACGSYGTTGGGAYGSGSTNPPAPTTGGSNSSAVIQTATTTIKGQSETVLTNAQGLTLYYFTADSATQSAVSGNLAQIWHAACVALHRYRGTHQLDFPHRETERTNGCKR